MKTARWAACASGLAFLFLTGCSSLNNVAGYFALASDASGQDRLVAGSLETVAQSTQGTLSQLGFSASQSQRGDSIYISSKTATGASFTLVLTRVKQADGSEKTKVHLDWNGAKDDQTGVHILGQLDGTMRR